jgi:hypothetical protein
MSRTIDLLEQLGRSGDARLVAEAGKSEQISAAERAELSSGDCAALATLIGARTVMACLIVAPDNDPMPEEQPVQPDETPDDGKEQAA